MTLQYEAHDEPDIDKVWAWYEYQIALIGESHASVLQLINPGSNIATPVLPHETRFIGFTRSEVDEFFERQREHLEILTMFQILATTEAILRIEVKTRVATRKKDPLSRKLRELDNTKDDRMRLDEDILVAMKDAGVSANAIAAFRGALKLRHWLAHGRHWHPKLGRGYAPSDVFDISRKLIDSIPPT